MLALYDRIGGRYADLRRPDARIAAAVLRALGDSRSVANVGAGTGSYEPSDRLVVAIEPAWTMLEQRCSGAAAAVQGDAMAIPLAAQSVDAALAILTIHHWPDWARGVRELRRIARNRVVVLTWDPAAPGFWLTDYFPEILAIDRRIFPALMPLRRALGEVSTRAVAIPHDCTDGFLGAYWRRPQAYLDPAVRASISTFSKLADADSALGTLRRDLATGVWHRRYGHLLDRAEMDLGYRLLVAEA